MPSNGLLEYIYATACIAVLVFVAFFAAYSGSCNQSQFKQQAPGIEANQQTNSSTKASAIPTLSRSAPERALGAGSTEGAEKGSEYWPWLIFGFRLKVTDSLLALFTLLLFFVGTWQGYQLNRTVAAAERTERAYVFFCDVCDVRDQSLSVPGSQSGLGRREGSEADRDEEVVQKVVIYRNSGRTPAVVTKIRLGCDVFPVPPEPQNAPSEEMPIGGVIGAGVEWPRGRIALTLDKIERAKAGKGLIYLYGEIVYRDIFRKERRSWFCRRWQGQQFILSDLIDEKLNGYT